MTWDLLETWQQRIISEIRRDIGKKSWLFYTLLHSTPPLWRSPSEHCHPVWCEKTTITSEFWYIWCTMVHLTFGTLHQCFGFGTLGPLLLIFGTFGTVFTFGTPVAFGTRRIGSVFSALGIITNEFWFIWCTLVHLTFGTPVGTLHHLVH